MNTLKTQISSNVKGFTLVELIVVITILVILGTIAFLNLGGMSASARDSQRTSDLNQISQQINVTQAKQGTSYMNMLSGTTVRTIVSPSIAGASISDSWVYNAGDVNYTLLGIDPNKMSDPTSAGVTKYKMGATTLDGTAYQIAASLEETKTACVIGSYTRRTIAGTTATSTATGVLTVTIPAADAGKFKIGDTLTTGGKITGIGNGSAGVIIGTTAQVSATGTVVLAADEVAGLIAGSTTDAANAVTNGNTNLPY